MIQETAGALQDGEHRRPSQHSPPSTMVRARQAGALIAILLSLILNHGAAADEVIGVVSTGAAAIYLPDSCTTNCSGLQVAAPGEPEIVNTSAPESSGAAAGPLEELIIDEVPAITNPDITITPVPGPAEFPSPSAEDLEAIADVISPAGEKEEPSEEASSEVLEAASPSEQSPWRAPEEAVGPESAAAPDSQANTEEEAVGIPEDAPALQPGPEGAEEEAAAEPSEDIQAPKDIPEGAPEAATSESKEESPPSPKESEELPKTGEFGGSEGVAPSEEGPIPAEEVTAEESEEAGSESPGPSAEAVEENWEEVKVSEEDEPLEEDNGAASPSEAKPEASEGTLESEVEEMLNHEIEEIVVKVIFEAP